MDGGQFVGRALGWLPSLCPYLPHFPFPLGRKVVVVRCEGINISGNFYRNKCKLSYVLGEWLERVDLGDSWPSLAPKVSPLVVGSAHLRSLTGPWDYGCVC